MRIETILLPITLVLFLGCAQKEKEIPTYDSESLKNVLEKFPAIKKEAKHKILTLGTFHFDRSLDGSDIIAKNHMDIRSETNQIQIDSLVQILKTFKPTRIAVEWRPDFQNEMDSLYQEFQKGKWKLQKNEAFQIGFRLGRLLNHEKIYCVDNNPPMPPSVNAIDDIEVYAEAIGHTQLWHAYDDDNLAFNTFMDTVQNGLYVLDYIKLLNSDQYRKRTKQIWTTGLVNLGYGDSYVGADFLGRWYQRNARIFANTTNLAKNEEEHILVIYGAAHKWVLDELYASSPDFELVQLKDLVYR